MIRRDLCVDIDELWLFHPLQSRWLGNGWAEQTTSEYSQTHDWTPDEILSSENSETNWWRKLCLLINKSEIRCVRLVTICIGTIIVSSTHKRRVTMLSFVISGLSEKAVSPQPCLQQMTAIFRFTSTGMKCNFLFLHEIDRVGVGTDSSSERAGNTAKYEQIRHCAFQ